MTTPMITTENCLDINFVCKLNDFLSIMYSELFCLAKFGLAGQILNLARKHLMSGHYIISSVMIS